MSQPFAFNFKRKRQVRKPKIAPTRKVVAWSNEQDLIFNEIANGTGHTVVLAAPGSGKSTTIVEGVYHVPPDRRILYTAFNSLAAKHLRTQIPEYAQGKTHHQVGFHTTLKHWGPIYGLNAWGCVDKKEDSVLALAKEMVGGENIKLHMNLVDAVRMAKTVLADTIDQIEAVMDVYGIDPCGIPHREFAIYVSRMMEKTREAPLVFNGKSVITFVDMIWLPHANGWMPEQYDIIFADEGQDLGSARMELIMNALAPGARLTTVGDKFQAIFGFAGASTQSLDNMVRDLNAKSLSLSVSYRCARSIIEMAQEINPMIRAAPGAPDGTVEHFDIADIMNRIEPGMAILSRANYPLVRLCFRLLKDGFNANIAGKDIGDRFLWRIKSWQPETVPALVKSVNAWRDEVVARLVEKRRDPTGIIDEAESILTFTENANSLTDVRDNISRFFSDDDAQIKLSSTHKAKGLEWEKVMLLNKTYHPERGDEELNIYYVAITRAKRHLLFAEGKVI